MKVDKMSYISAKNIAVVTFTEVDLYSLHLLARSELTNSECFIAEGITDKTRQLCSDLAAFNKLDVKSVSIIGNVMGVDAASICGANGIVYFDDLTTKGEDQAGKPYTP